MNYKDLRIIINHVKKSTTCHKCGKSFLDRDIDIVGSIDGVHHFFNVHCNKCETSALLQVTIEEIFPAGHLPKLGTAPRMECITHNDVLDMHNFLKTFDGNFSTIFKKTT